MSLDVKNALVAALLLIAAASLYSWVTLGSPPDTASPAALPNLPPSTEGPDEGPRLANGGSPPTRTLPPATDAASVESAFSGSLLVYGQGPDVEVELLWRAPDGSSRTCTALGPTWSCALPPDRYELVSAQCASGRLELVTPAYVSIASPTADIELASPESFLLDVREAVSGRRLTMATVMSSGIAAEPDAPVAVTRFSSPITTGSGQAVEAGTGAWVLSTPSPVLLPGRPPDGRVTVTAPGYLAADVDALHAPGVRVVELSREPRLIVQLVDSLGRDGAYHVECAFPECGRLQSFSSVRPPRELAVELPFEASTPSRAEVSVHATVRGGRGPRVLLRQFEPPFFEALVVDLANADLGRTGGALEVVVDGTIVRAGAADDWSLELRPVDELLDVTTTKGNVARRWSSGDAALPEPTAGPLRATFDALDAGDYRVRLLPWGVEEVAHVEEGQRTSVHFRIDALARLRVIPTDASGTPRPEATHSGTLVWRSLDNAVAASRSRHPAYAHNQGESEWGVDILLGYARFAQSVEDGWEIVTLPDQELAIDWLGPAALGAETLRLHLGPGLQETTLTFSGL